MRKTTFLIIIIFYLSARFQAGYCDAKRVSLELNDKPLTVAFKKLSAQTNLSFIYGDSLIEGIYVSCDFTNLPLEDALDELLFTTGLSFKLTKLHQVVIFQKRRKLSQILSGYILDRTTHESLPYANISLLGTNRGEMSDKEGHFAMLDLPDETFALKVQYIGYCPREITINPTQMNQEKLIIELEQKPVQGNEIVLEINESEIFQISNEISQLAISPIHFSDLPYIGDKDISRTLQLMPGISASNFGASGLNIRGGLPSQNLILLDGMKLYHINHLFGFFSAFNSDAIKDTRIYKGGFPARYGERLSGVIDMTAKNGNMNSSRLSVSLSQAISSVVLELPLFKIGSILLSIRRSYSDLILGSLYDRVERTLYQKKINTDGIENDSTININATSGMYFYDVLGKLTLLPTNKDILTFSYYNGSDHLNGSEKYDSGIEWRNTKSEWGNLGYSVKWYHQWQEKFTTTTLVTYSDYFTRYIMSENSADSYLSFILQPDDTLYTTATNVSNNVADFSVHFDNQWQFSTAHTFEFGAFHSQTQIRFGTRNEYLHVEELGLEDKLEKAFLYSTYLQDSWRLHDAFRISGGLRANYFEALKNVDWEPRISVNYRMSSQMSLNAAWGKYNQYILQYGDGSQTLDGAISWISANSNEQKPASAQDIICGVKYETSNYLFNIEAYRKKLDNILDAFSDWQYMDTEQYSQPIESRVTGIDFIAQKKSGNFNGWISYGFSRSMNYIDSTNQSYPANQDIPHNINIVGNYNFGNFRFSAAWNYVSGRPYSVPELKKIFSYLTFFYYYYLTPPLDRNTERLPASHQLDISFNWYFNFNFINGKMGISVFDVYNQRNIWYRDFTTDDGELGKVDVRMFGTTPTFFLELHF